MTNPRVLFAGTPEFALASFKSLVASGVVPVAVLTQPDRPAGRGKQLTASPVKQFAMTEGILVLQPPTLKDKIIVEALAALEPDIMIVAAYGLLLPQDVLDIPARGCLNVHASILPRWRGASPIQAAILGGDKTSGISLMAMTAGLDTGAVYASEAIDIGADETAGELHDRLAVLGGKLLANKLAAILANELQAVEQDESKASYAGKIATDDAAMNWRLSADELCREVRAYNPAPGAWFMIGNERVKCWRASCVGASNETAGTVMSADRDGIVVACNSGALAMQELQRPGKGRVSAREFAAQSKIHGTVLG